MRFPRALAIRENLSVSDCIAASGAVVGFISVFILLTFERLGILEAVRSEKKRKMENAPEFAVHVLHFPPRDC